MASQVKERRETKNDAPVRLKDVTDFAWDRIYVFPPYTGVKQINKALGYDWDEAGNIGLEKLDSFNLMVFTGAGTVVGYAKYPRNLGDFRGISEERKQKGFTPEEAVFMIDLEDSLRSPLVLRWQVK